MDPVELNELVENVQYHKEAYDTRGINKNRIAYRKALLELMKFCKNERDKTTPKKIKQQFKEETQE